MEALSADLIFSTDWNPLPVAAAYQTSQETGSAFPQLDLVRESRHDMTSPRAVRARLSHTLCSQKHEWRAAAQRRRWTWNRCSGLRARSRSCGRLMVILYEKSARPFGHGRALEPPPPPPLRHEWFVLPGRQKPSTNLDLWAKAASDR